ncbi:MAG: aspartate aminotransferase family protein [Ignavibacteriaceae bacterium]|nr:aspartate aminotransferase family protein [Ignavibacteriaceae bacterium]
MVEKQESVSNYYYEKYGELINSWYMNHLLDLGIINTGIKAEGATITDSKGNIFIDCTSGFGLGNLGHNNPVIVEAIIDQLRKKEVNTRPFINKNQIELAELLKNITPDKLECSYLFNSGSEAIESAIKLVRLYKGQKKIISMKNSFHGFTLGALSASGVASFRKPYEPLLPGFEQLEFDNFEELNRLNDKEVGALLIEPIQHDAGIRIPSKKYLQEIRKLCDEKNIILIFDEVITGIGKTGYMFASDYFQVIPDIMVIGKSLGAGLIPVGAIITNKNLWQRFGLSFPMSATSYGGNSLACRTAIESIKFIQSNNILNSVREKGLIISDQLNQMMNNYPDIILSFSGIGLMFGIEIINNNIAFEIVRGLVKKNIIVYQSFGNANIIMLEPPLVITTEQILRVINGFKEVLAKQHSKNVTMKSNP